MPADLMPIANHLWQSTVFAVVVCFLAWIFRRNSAAVRHRLWVAASIKFLIPFSLQVGVGNHVQWRKVPVAPPPAVSLVIGEMGEPFTVSTANVPSRLSTVRLQLWIVGVAVNIVWWLFRWLQVGGRCSGPHG